MVPYGDEQAYENSAASVIIMTGAIAIIAILEKKLQDAVVRYFEK